MNVMETIKKFTDMAFRDPIAGILLKHSNLTKTQYESLIIDLISESVSDIKLTYKEKALLRSKSVSRGSFGRTLSQARKKVISAIYTILLLNYIGVFEDSPLTEYQVLSEKLRDYVKIVRDSDPSRAKNVLKRIEKELIDGIRVLSEPRGLKIT